MTIRFAVVLCVVCLLASSLAGAVDRLVVGEPVGDVRETPHPYVALGSGVNDGTPRVIWSETLHHPGATYIAPHFSRFHLAAGDWVIVRSPDGKQSWRYEQTGKAGLGVSEGGFWSGHIKGDSAVVELWSAGGAGGWGFRLDSFARGFDDDEIAERNGLSDTRAICGGDNSQEAVCFSSTEPEMYEQSNAVMRLLITGQFLCTGWLIGCEGQMMTNNHCISTQNDASNTDYEFMAQGGSCATNCAGSLACPGVVEADAGTLIRTDGALDYSLVQLPGELHETYGFMRLRPEGPNLDERIYIPQHPAGWGKRIASLSTASQDPSGFCQVFSLNRPPCSGGPGDVGYYCDTQGGSSGSPVLGYDDHRVVSLHHCANCPNRGVNIVDVIASLGADMPSCATLQLAGSLAIDRSLIRCDDALQVTVADDSLIGFGMYPVDVSSSTEIGPESFELFEISPGVFQGVLGVSGSAVESGDSAIGVSHGDTVTIEYVDGDDGDGGSNIVIQRTASVDCVAPTVSGVQIGAVDGSSAVIDWSTDEPSDTLLSYSPPLTDVSVGAMALDHQADLVGLEACTVHQFGLTATDAAGNVTLDDNGGSFYSFQTAFESRPPRASLDTPLGVPDQLPTGVTSTITVVGDFPVLDVDVEINVSHGFVGELGIQLFAPDGSLIQLARRRGGSGDNYTATRFDDDAALSIAQGSAPFNGSFRPEHSLDSLVGLNAAGDWRLRVVDSGGESVGQFISWTLLIERPEESCSISSAPAAVPDGTAGFAPLRVERVGVAADRLDLSWDAGCNPPQTKLIYGALSQVADYAIAGELCGAGSPATLDPAPAGDLWFLAIGQSDDGAESSWGTGAAGERNGLVPSGTCGATQKIVSAVCP